MNINTKISLLMIILLTSQFNYCSEESLDSASLLEKCNEAIEKTTKNIEKTTLAIAEQEKKQIECMESLAQIDRFIENNTKDIENLYTAINISYMFKPKEKSECEVTRAEKKKMQTKLYETQTTIGYAQAEREKQIKEAALILAQMNSDLKELYSMKDTIISKQKDASIQTAISAAAAIRSDIAEIETLITASRDELQVKKNELASTLTENIDPAIKKAAYENIEIIEEQIENKTIGLETTSFLNQTCVLIKSKLTDLPSTALPSSASAAVCLSAAVIADQATANSSNISDIKTASINKLRRDRETWILQLQAMDATVKATKEKISSMEILLENPKGLNENAQFEYVLRLSGLETERDGLNNQKKLIEKKIETIEEQIQEATNQVQNLTSAAVLPSSASAAVCLPASAATVFGMDTTTKK